MTEIGRNTPCPCGSGKKYKRCCGIDAAKASAEKIPELLEHALQLHQRGQLQEAAALYREILQCQPRHADSLHLLGLVAHQQGDHNKAIELIKQAVAQNDRSYIYFNSLGNAYRAAGKPAECIVAFKRALLLAPESPEVITNLGVALYEHGFADDALEQFRRAIAFNPNFADVHFALGNTLKALNKTDEAIASYQRCIAINPNSAEAHYNLANLLLQQDKHADAIASYQHALALRPQHAEAWFNLGAALKANNQPSEAIDAYTNATLLKPDYAEAFCFLGELYFEQDRLAEAEECYKKALELKPSDSKTHNAYGKLLNQQGQIEATIAHYETAIASDPKNAVAYCNLGMMRAFQGNTDEAIRCLQRAISIQPNLAAAYYNIALLHEGQEQLDQALKSYQSAIKAKPDYAEAHWNRALVFLQTGKLKQGWDEYEWRWSSADFTSAPRPFTYPWWDGTPLKGKTLLIWPEQGLGDEILFASVIQDAINAAEHCVIECQIRLAPLYARSFPNAEIIPALNIPHARTLQSDIQLQIPVGSLPRWFRQTIDSFPPSNAYLKADPERVAFWKNRLDALGNGPKVGICWRSGLRSKKRDVHYTELSQWGDLLTIPGVVFVNLQYGEAREELAEAQEKFGVPIHVWNDIDLKNDIDDVAALTKALDLVITAPTAVSAISGGLGVPTWCMSTGKSWDQLGADSYLWTPSVRFTNRAADQPWEEVLSVLATELAKLAEKAI